MNSAVTTSHAAWSVHPVKQTVQFGYTLMSFIRRRDHHCHYLVQHGEVAALTYLRKLERRLKGVNFFPIPATQHMVIEHANEPPEGRSGMDVSLGASR